MPLADPLVGRGQTMTITAGATLAAGARVKLNSSLQAVVAGMTEPCIGYVDERGGVSGSECGILLDVGMCYAVAHSAMTVGSLVYAQASGRVDDADGGSAKIVGYTWDAASAQDDVIRVVRSLS